MERREAIRLLATAAALPLIPTELLGLLRTARTAAEGGSALRTLNAQQNATVTRLAELILPETDTPGATAARVNEFIDLILTEWYSNEERERFLSGLANVDTFSQTSFGKNFLACKESQQVKMLTDLDHAMDREATPREAGEGDPFFRMLKQLTLTGYFTSEVGAKQALHFHMIPGHYDGCVTIAPAERSK